jgi:formate dehydrogenase subunit delta
MTDGMMSNLERLVYMANQIARNFEALGSDVAAAATGDHLLQFWDPHMKRQIIGQLDRPDCGLTATAREAVRIMKRGWKAGETSVPGVEAASAPDGASDAG